MNQNGVDYESNTKEQLFPLNKSGITVIFLPRGSLFKTSRTPRLSVVLFSIRYADPLHPYSLGSSLVFGYKTVSLLYICLAETLQAQVIGLLGTQQLPTRLGMVLVIYCGLKTANILLETR